MYHVYRVSQETTTKKKRQHTRYQKRVCVFQVAIIITALAVVLGTEAACGNLGPTVLLPSPSPTTASSPHTRECHGTKTSFELTSPISAPLVTGQLTAQLNRVRVAIVAVRRRPVLASIDYLNPLPPSPPTSFFFTTTTLRICHTTIIAQHS